MIAPVCFVGAVVVSWGFFVLGEWSRLVLPCLVLIACCLGSLFILFDDTSFLFSMLLAKVCIFHYRLSVLSCSRVFLFSGVLFSQVDGTVLFCLADLTNFASV